MIRLESKTSGKLKLEKVGGFLFLPFLLMCLMPLSHAAVALDPDFKGTVMITHPNGEIEMFEPGQSIPGIPLNALIQVFKGNMNLLTEAEDKVQLSCLGHVVDLSGGADAALSCEETDDNKGLLIVRSGPIQVTDPQGKVIVLKTGDRYPIEADKEKEAEPTSQTNAEEGAPAGADLGDETNVDSRNIQSSPF